MPRPSCLTRRAPGDTFSFEGGGGGGEMGVSGRRRRLALARAAAALMQLSSSAESFTRRRAKSRRSAPMAASGLGSGRGVGSNRRRVAWTAAARVVARHRLKNAARSRARWTRRRLSAVARAPACRFSGVIASSRRSLARCIKTVLGVSEVTRMRGRLLSGRGAAAHSVLLSVRCSRRGTCEGDGRLGKSVGTLKNPCSARRWVQGSGSAR